MTPPTTNAARLPREYTQLDGGEGREIRYRPDRHSRAALGLVQGSAQVSCGEERFLCRVHDISQSGVALEWDAFVDLPVGTELERLVLTFDGHEAYRGRARVASARRASDAGEKLLGLSLLESLVDVDALLRLRDVRQKAADAVDGLRGREAPWKLEGLHAFKSLVADLRLLLEDGRERLDALEASLPPDLLRAREPSPARDALAASVRQEFSDVVRDALGRIDAASRDAAPTEGEAVRAFSRRQLLDLLMCSPWGRRAREKPLGYPGDYQIMNGLYGNHFDGATLYGRAVNLALVWAPAAEAVRTRKDLMVRELSAALDRAPAGRPVRVLSVAAGPAEELFQLLSEREHLSAPLEIVLFEQDRGALAYAYDRLTRLVRRRWPREVSLVLLHDSIKRLLLDSQLFAASGTFDVVYACGLADYLQRNAWIKMARTLYRRVAPGGTLYVGNMVPSNPTRWMMEAILDWPLVYRERAELLELGALAAPEANAELRLCEEPTGVNPLVAFRRG